MVGKGSDYLEWTESWIEDLLLGLVGSFGSKLCQMILNRLCEGRKIGRLKYSYVLDGNNTNLGIIWTISKNEWGQGNCLMILTGYWYSIGLGCVFSRGMKSEIRCFIILFIVYSSSC